MTHSSWCAENDSSPSNQRLEFLGDAVLGLVVAHRLYAEPRGLTEGEMSQVRAAVVSKSALAEVGGALGLGEALRLGKGEESTGGRGNPSLLADALEAVIAAVYLDDGIEAADAVVCRVLGDLLQTAVRQPGSSDFKTRLQEMAASAGVAPPKYNTTASGPEHDKRFRASVSAGGVVGVGEGSTKKRAAQRAAEAACCDLLNRLERAEGTSMREEI